jgi:hypothetical protein
MAKKLEIFPAQASLSRWLRKTGSNPRTWPRKAMVAKKVALPQNALIFIPGRIDFGPMVAW